MKKFGLLVNLLHKVRLKKMPTPHCLILFLALIMGTLSEQTAFAQNKTITISIKQASMEEVFKEIKKQSDYTFFYHQKDVAGRQVKDVKVSSTAIRIVLNEVLKGTNLGYNIENNVVIITPKQKTELPRSKQIVTGSVVDESGESLPGVSIIIKGKSAGTTTDAKGEFSIMVDRTGSEVLSFSFLGMKNLDRHIREGEQNLKIKLLANTEVVEDVVITGYEVVDKRKLTGSIYTLKSDDILEPTGMTLDNMLQGKVPGMVVMQNTSTPGVAPKIRIRGSSSILGNREPIWVVDGIILSDPVKISNAELNSMDKVNLIGNAISFLNPQDIDRIDVLKDASATAIYGTKAANGVVVITTKRGKAGKMSLNYNLNTSVKERPSYNTLNLMNSDQRVQLSQEIAERGLSFPQGTDPLIGYEGLLNDFWNKTISYEEFNRKVDVIRQANTDWYDELLRTPFSHNHNISLSGGNDRTTYYVSGSFAVDNGVQLNTNAKRQTFSANVSSYVFPKVHLSASFGGSFGQNSRTHSSVDLPGYAYNTSRAIQLYDENGALFYYPGKNSIVDEAPYVMYNILNELDHTGNTQKSNTMTTNIQLNYDIIPSLKVSGQFAYEYSDVKSEEWADEQSYYICEDRQVPFGYEIPESYKKSTVNPFGGDYSYSSTSNSTITGRVNVNYNKMLGKHGIDLMVGSDVRSMHYTGNSKYELGYYPERGKTFVTNVPVEYSAYHKAVSNNTTKLADNVTNSLSFYGVARYSYANKYIFNFNVRTDGSNKFGQDKSNRFLPVWSVSGRWNITQEKFFTDRLKFIDLLALKLSYGFQGNVLDEQNPFMVIRQGSFDATAQQFANMLVRYPNPFLTWEKTRSYNAGIEFGFFNGFLSGGFEYYYKKGEDQIVGKRVTPDNGGTSFNINEGNIENKGWDLSINFNFIRTQNIDFGMGFNTGMNKNRVTNSGNPDMTSWEDYINGSLVRDGYSVNSFYSYRFGGLDDRGLPTFNGIEFLDKDYDGAIQDVIAAINSAMVYSGSREPITSGGLSLNFRYKRFSLSTSFAYALGNKVRMFDLYENDNQTLVTPIQNMSDEFLDRWQKPGDQTNIPVLSDLPLRTTDENTFRVSSNYWQMYNKSDLRVVPGDYLRCTSLSASYRLPDNLIKNKIGIQGCTLGFGCNNLFTLASKKLRGQDPETFGGSRTVPPQRTYSFSLNLSF